MDRGDRGFGSTAGSSAPLELLEQSRADTLLVCPAVSSL